MISFRRICVYCGSSPGLLPAYRDAAVELGRTLAGQGIGMVYGGASVGLMGAAADSALEAGGEVIGVVPAMIDGRIGHEGLTEKHVVATMHERKQMMFDLSDGFIALPGGVGTFEEFFEAQAWAQLYRHGKPCGLLNVAGYYDLLLAFLDHAVEQRFFRTEHRAMIQVDQSPAGLLDAMRHAHVSTVDKWIDMA